VVLISVIIRHTSSILAAEHDHPRLEQIGESNCDEQANSRNTDDYDFDSLVNIPNFCT